MGFVDDIKAREDLTDEQKTQFIAAFSDEVDPLKTELGTVKARDRRTSVDAEVEALGAMFSDDLKDNVIGLQKFYRRVLLSPDAEEPGAVLLSDNELGLSGNEATGHTGREEISAAGVLREFVKLLPRKEGEAIGLSDMASISQDHGRPSKGSTDDMTPEERAADRAARSSKLSGRTVVRDRSKRYGGSTVGVDV